MTEGKTIKLSFDKYQELLSLLKNNPESLIFRCGDLDDIVEVSIRNNKPKNNSKSKEQNIVEKWMNEIIGLAESGYNGTNSSFAEKYFMSIKSYCKSVIISVTS